MGIAQLPASLLPQILTADKLLMPDGVTSIAEHYRSFSNRNLLDNWYFAKPINQRGKTKWTIAPKPSTGVDANTEYAYTGYTIDRWYISGSGSCTIADDGVILTHIPGNGSDHDRVDFVQKFENYAQMKGNLYTASFLIDGALYSKTFIMGTISSYADSILTSNMSFYSIDSLPFLLRLYRNESVKIKAAKLEPGPFQTLAHMEGNTWVLNDPPPNYALELLKCQRYFYAANAIGNSIAYFGQGTTNNTNTLVEIEVQIPNMRSYPAVSYRGSFYLESENGEKLPVTGISVFRSGVVSPILLGVKTSGTLTKGKLYRLLANDDSNARIIFDSNL